MDSIRVTTTLKQPFDTPAQAPAPADAKEVLETLRNRLACHKTVKQAMVIRAKIQCILEMYPHLE